MNPAAVGVAVLFWFASFPAGLQSGNLKKHQLSKASPFGLVANRGHLGTPSDADVTCFCLITVWNDTNMENTSKEAYIFPAQACTTAGIR